MRAPGSVSGGLAANSEDAAGPAVDRVARASIAPPQPDRGAALRAAAAGGRSSEVEALLTQGAPVDAPDAAGDTALMKSVQAGQPAVAALLRRHGASLDRRNHAGENARDMATRKGDPALDEALGLAP
jgi:ankyrin repeat protein